MRFEFASATRIIFGAGALREISAIARSFGTRALVVTGRSTGRAQLLLDMLGSAGLLPSVFPIEGEPSIDSIVRGVRCAKEKQCDLVIGFGGGSAMDAGKAIAALMTNDGDVFDYLEVIGRGRALINSSAPFIAIPTTAGTGAEVTRNAVLRSEERRVGKECRSRWSAYH